MSLGNIDLRVIFAAAVAAPGVAGSFIAATMGYDAGTSLLIGGGTMVAGAIAGIVTGIVSGLVGGTLLSDGTGNESGIAGAFMTGSLGFLAGLALGSYLSFGYLADRFAKAGDLPEPAPIQQTVAPPAPSLPR